jgi:hypothetical protein
MYERWSAYVARRRGWKRSKRDTSIATSSTEDLPEAEFRVLRVVLNRTWR